MRYSLFSSFIGLSVAMFSQQQQQLQQLGNVFLASNINPAIKLSQSNIGNYRNNDNNSGNQMAQFDNSDENMNDIQEQSLSNIKQSANNPGIDFGFSLNISSRSSSPGPSNSRSNRHTFTKKFKKFERHVFGKMGSHKKSKHLVDVCFNWS